MLSSWILPVLEWIGTVSFAISGSMVAIGHGLDLFGVLMVGTITAVGGGIIRDLILGNVPPLIFSNTDVLLVSVLAGLAVFVLARINAKRVNRVLHRVEFMNLLFDSFGLAAFSVAGVRLAWDGGFEDQMVLCVLMGMLTGVGGGVVRDMLVNVKPYVFTKHVYAVASLSGSLLYYLILVYTPFGDVGSFIALGLVILIRLLAAKYRWELPKIKPSQLEE